MSEGAQNGSGTGFSADYVKELRDEAAGWRNKFRELEGRLAQAEIGSELAKRGVKADASWVKRTEGMSVADAVDSFIAQYPHLAAQPAQSEQGPAPSDQRMASRAPAPMSSTRPNSNHPGPKAGTALAGKDLEAIKQDPKLRKELNSIYRSLVSQTNHKSEE